MNKDSTLRVALIGCGVRGTTVYLPVLRKMNCHFRPVAVCDPQKDRADAAASFLRATAYNDLDKLLDECRIDLAVVAVTPPPSHLNAAVAQKCLEAGVNLLAETPIAPTLPEADKLIATAQRTGAKVEIGENYYRTPAELFKRSLIDAGVFGGIQVVYSDYVGHGYHGISLLRSYVGFDVDVTRVIGLTHEYPVQLHMYREGEPWRDTESWQFGVLEFGNGAHGIFSFSTLAYYSPLRWGREKCMVRFYAERGMGAGNDLAILHEGKETRPIGMRPRYATVDGQMTIAAIESDLPGNPGWENPLRDYGLLSGNQHDELTIGLELLSIYRALVEGVEPEYGIFEARYDRQLDLAMSESWSNHGQPVLIEKRELVRTAQNRS
ncbi:MAG TPA: Gfo/Idh/MocA family oxidoreductase [Pyrinomonadaceae bacterium]|nr:Gfo/Idh/MocA family oxidoreductase [Pyrinomonadaceae bacterium]